jgi:hypothetical protein
MAMPADSNLFLDSTIILAAIGVLFATVLAALLLHAVLRRRSLARAREGTNAPRFNFHNLRRWRT